MDVLFVNILQNKHSPQVRADVDLVEKTIHLFEKYDTDHERSNSYLMTRALRDIASKALQGTVIEGQAHELGRFGDFLFPAMVDPPNQDLYIDGAAARSGVREGRQMDVQGAGAVPCPTDESQYPTSMGHDKLGFHPLKDTPWMSMFQGWSGSW
jgi:hypothetical protein